MDYRKEIFRLCKKLQTNGEVQKIQHLIHDMSVSVEHRETGIFHASLHGDFAYLAKRCNSQFHGYLYLDEHLEHMELPIPLKVEHLAEDERAFMERGHRTLTRLVELCLGELKEKESLAAEAADPYFFLHKVSCSATAEPLLSDEELQPAVDAFQKGKVYQAILAFDLEKLFQKLPRENMLQIATVMEKEIGQSYDEEEVSEDMQKFSLSLYRQKGMLDAVSYLIACVAILTSLKSSLTISCRMLYEAICGGDLMVLNNENVIAIEKSSSNALFKSCKVLMQGLYINPVNQGVGSVVLLDCTPSETRHLHEFGMVTGITESIKRDLGETTRFTYVVLDDELNPLHNLTNAIIRAKVPEMRAFSDIHF